MFEPIDLADLLFHLDKTKFFFNGQIRFEKKDNFVKYDDMYLVSLKRLHNFLIENRGVNVCYL